MAAPPQSSFSARGTPWVKESQPSFPLRKSAVGRLAKGKIGTIIFNPRRCHWAEIIWAFSPK